jgi:hypothetical protein
MTDDTTPERQPNDDDIGMPQTLARVRMRVSMWGQQEPQHRRDLIAASLNDLQGALMDNTSLIAKYLAARKAFVDHTSTERVASDSATDDDISLLQLLEGPLHEAWAAIDSFRLGEGASVGRSVQPAKF